jgi:predicted TIM-barrel fold metal-dependent hydrolase
MALPLGWASARKAAKALLWGGDWPLAAFEDSMRYEYAIASFRQWVPDANMRRIISGETAFRLYFA